jgi:tRNA 2-selenouridine synthase SelU
MKTQIQKATVIDYIQKLRDEIKEFDKRSKDFQVRVEILMKEFIQEIEETNVQLIEAKDNKVEVQIVEHKTMNGKTKKMIAVPMSKDGEKKWRSIILSIARKLDVPYKTKNSTDDVL